MCCPYPPSSRAILFNTRSFRRDRRSRPNGYHRWLPLRPGLPSSVDSLSRGTTSSQLFQFRLAVIRARCTGPIPREIRSVRRSLETASTRNGDRAVAVGQPCGQTASRPSEAGCLSRLPQPNFSKTRDNNFKASAQGRVFRANHRAFFQTIFRWRFPRKRTEHE